MMKMGMRLDKSQVPSRYEFRVAGSFAFTARDLSLMAGFSSYDALLVGASGGFGGSYTETSTPQGSLTMFGGGPGGAGSLRLQDALKNLPTAQTVVVGATGANASDATNTFIGSSEGGDGGDTTFNGYTAYGSAGGHGARYLVNGLGYQMYEQATSPADGGGNSAGLGSNGAGGSSAYRHWNNSNVQTSAGPAVAPTDGLYAAGGSAPVVGGGIGGGGGPGYFNKAVSGGSALDGANGNSSAFVDAGGARASSTGKGGAGGGADLFPLTGVHEYFGTKTAGKNPGGAIIIRFS